MVQPDPALGIAVNFPQELFENGILFAMQMGKPNDPDKQVVFLFPGTGVTYWKNGVSIPPPPLDLDGHPYDPDVEVRKGGETEVRVDCAVEVGEVAPDREDPVGTFQRTQLTITLLAAQYAEAAGAQAVLYNGDRYVYSFEPTNYGLFGANVHQMIFVSKDDS